MNIAVGTVVGLAMTLMAASSVAASPGYDPGPHVGLNARTAAVGIVEGTVRLRVTADAPPPMLSPYSRRQYRPQIPAPQTGSSPAAVVVYLIPDRASAAPSSATAVITQRGRTILPHVTVVQTGTRIQFPNEDEVFHNLFSLSSARPFNLGRYAPGDSRTIAFGKAGVVKMFCDIHAEMAGIIVVVDTPYFTKPDNAGRYRLTGVPDGRYRIVAWHDAAGADTATVTVRSSGVTRADFELGG